VGFSAATLTAVFAVYVLFLLATVLIFGSLPDHVGRNQASACGARGRCEASANNILY
jgi:hypothetical protein